MQMELHVLLSTQRSKACEGNLQQRRNGEDHDTKAELTETRQRNRRRLAALSPIEQHRDTAERLRDRLDILLAFRCLNEEEVGTCLFVQVGPLQRALEALGGPGIRAIDNREILGTARCDGCAVLP